MPGRRAAADHAGRGRRDRRRWPPSATAGIPDDDLPVLGYDAWLTGLRRGIAAHHAGLLPTFKEVVEELFEAGLVRAVFATETLALGINMPARTVVIERLDKWNGETHADLTPGEYTQLTGRAGRRGIDVEGHAVVLWHPDMDPASVAGPGRHPDLPAELQLPAVLQHGGQPGRPGRPGSAPRSCWSRRSPSSRPTGAWSAWPARPAALREELGRARAVSCDRGDIAGYARIRRELSELEREQARHRSRRAAAAEAAGVARRGCGRGDIIHGARRPPGRASPWCWSRRADGGGPLPLVLTEGRQVKRLSAGRLPGPGAAPSTGSGSRRRSAPGRPAQRRDLAATVRNKLAGRDLARPRPRGEASGAGHGRRTTPRSPGCAGHCASTLPPVPRPRGAPARGRALRPARAGGRRPWSAGWPAGRTCWPGPSTGSARCWRSSATSSGDEVTAEGRRLSRLYTELDLVAAECLRRGTWAGLTPPELAACVSALTFEARRPDDAGPPRLPRGRVTRGAGRHGPAVGRAGRGRGGAPAVVPARARPRLRLDARTPGPAGRTCRSRCGGLTPG